MKKIIDSIEQVISICGNDFTKWPNKMAPDVLKATYEMLKEYHEQLNRHGSVEIFSESDREQILEKVKIFYENKLAEKDKLASEEAMLRINEYQKLKKELDEKDKKYGILLADRDKLEMYRHNRLKKSDFHILCKNFKKTLNTRLDKHCGYNPDVTISIISHSKYESLEE